MKIAAHWCLAFIPMMIACGNGGSSTTIDATGSGIDAVGTGIDADPS